MTDRRICIPLFTPLLNYPECEPIYAYIYIYCILINFGYLVSDTSEDLSEFIASLCLFCDSTDKVPPKSSDSSVSTKFGSDPDEWLSSEIWLPRMDTSVIIEVGRNELIWTIVVLLSKLVDSVEPTDTGASKSPGCSDKTGVEAPVCCDKAGSVISERSCDSVDEKTGSDVASAVGVYSGGGSSGTLVTSACSFGVTVGLVSPSGYSSA